MSFEEKATYYKALAEPTRLRIISLLLEQESCTCVCELIKHIEKDQSVISRHVHALRDAGIITTSKEGRMVRCCLKDKKKAQRALEG